MRSSGWRRRARRAADSKRPSPERRLSGPSADPSVNLGSEMLKVRAAGQIGQIICQNKHYIILGFDAVCLTFKGLGETTGASHSSGSSGRRPPPHGSDDGRVPGVRARMAG